MKFEQNAQEQMQKVEELIAQINEAQRTCTEAINLKTEAVYAEATRQANATWQRIVVEVDSRHKTMGAEIQQIKSASAAAASSQTSAPGQGSTHDVVSPKHCPVGKISDEASVGDFRHLCDSIDNHLESHRT